LLMAHSDEKLESINGYQRVNRDCASFVNRRCHYVRDQEAKEETGRRIHR
jgi:hypothetical protein